MFPCSMHCTKVVGRYLNDAARARSGAAPQVFLHFLLKPIRSSLRYATDVYQLCVRAVVLRVCKRIARFRHNRSVCFLSLSLSFCVDRALVSLSLLARCMYYSVSRCLAAQPGVSHTAGRVKPRRDRFASLFRVCELAIVGKWFPPPPFPSLLIDRSCPRQQFPFMCTLKSSLPARRAQPPAKRTSLSR
jgi:hypothetical protein